VARDLKLLSGEYIDFIQTLCEIRNQFVHDVKAVSISLKEYMDNSDNKRVISKKVCKLVNPESEIRGSKVRAVDLFDLHPKMILQIAAMDLLADIHLGHERVQFEIRRERLTEEMLTLLQARRET
jgi:hypothetical protein